jgi:hypothetical protein
VLEAIERDEPGDNLSISEGSKELLCMVNSLETIKTMLLHRIQRNRPATGNGTELPKDDLNQKMRALHGCKIIVKTSVISDLCYQALTSDVSDKPVSRQGWRVDWR